MQLTTFLYTGGYRRDPFDPHLWSGIANRVFMELARRGRLRRAVGVSLSRPRTLALLLRHPHWSRKVVSARLQTSVPYREALNAEVARGLRGEELNGPCLQIGAMFNVARALGGRERCFSYHDGCLAEQLHSPLPPPPLPAREIDKALEFEGEVYRSMDRVFTFSRYLRDSIIKHHGVDEGRVAVLGAGINLDDLPEPAADKRYDSKEVLFIGVDFDRKGGQHLLRAFRAVRDKHPSAVLHLVGPRQLDLPPELSAGVQYHGFLSKRVERDAELLQELFDRSCLFVMPSLYEPFGIAPLEAMANGVPALVSDAWALRELVEPGLTGERVEVGSEEDLAEKITALLSSPERLKEMGERGRREVLAKYRWDDVVDRLLAFVDSKAS
ncbi:MAG TPA: glycosyltransferase family 4 protein [Pyrinomonadaceae bacterium]|jgi:glycosyltransferase involved in cell wall biosynthesis|nr:glycosyltransferase family 4 protein [Pyrinomonadaceae bacterium]